MKKKLFLILMLCAASQAGALELAGAKLDETLQLDGHQLVLSGVGLRTKYFFKVYVAGLYLGEKMHTSAAVLADSGPKRMLFHLLRDVSGTQMLEAINTSFPQNTSAEEMKALKPRLSEFSKIFASVGAIRKGEEITFDFVPPSGTVVTVGGVVKGRIEGADFNRALLKMWVGDKPAQADLKKNLLDGE